MKICRNCKTECDDNINNCPKCGERLPNDEHSYGTCIVCGRKLVNDYERIHSKCIYCEQGRSIETHSIKSKYSKRLKFFEIVSYIIGALSFICCFIIGESIPTIQEIMETAGLIIGIISLLIWIGIGTIFGALRDILDRQ